MLYSIKHNGKWLAKEKDTKDEAIKEAVGDKMNDHIHYEAQKTAQAYLDKKAKKRLNRDFFIAGFACLCVLIYMLVA